MKILSSWLPKQNDEIKQNSCLCTSGCLTKFWVHVKSAVDCIVTTTSTPLYSTPLICPLLLSTPVTTVHCQITTSDKNFIIFSFYQIFVDNFKSLKYQFICTKGPFGIIFGMLESDFENLKVNFSIW